MKINFNKSFVRSLVARAQLHVRKTKPKPGEKTIQPTRKQTKSNSLLDGLVFKARMFGPSYSHTSCPVGGYTQERQKYIGYTAGKRH